MDFRSSITRSCNPRRVNFFGSRWCRPSTGGFSVRCNALEYRIDFGDGTPIIVFTDVHEFELAHVYSQDGTFTIRATVVMEDRPDCDIDDDPDIFNFQENVTIDSSIPVCRNNDISRSRFERGVNNCDFLGIGTKIWWNKAIFGPFAGASTTAWIWDFSSAKWKPLRRAAFENFTINVSVDATFRGGGCGIIESKQKSDSCFCHNTRVSVSKANSAFADREIISTHSIVRGNCEIPTTTMELFRCQ